jgi:hypothetical protein
MRHKGMSRCSVVAALVNPRHAAAPSRADLCATRDLGPTVSVGIHIPMRFSALASLRQLQHPPGAGTRIETVAVCFFPPISSSKIANVEYRNCPNGSRVFVRVLARRHRLRRTKQTMRVELEVGEDSLVLGAAGGGRGNVTNDGVDARESGE